MEMHMWHMRALQQPGTVPVLVVALGRDPSSCYLSRARESCSLSSSTANCAPRSECCREKRGADPQRDMCAAEQVPGGRSRP